MSNKEEFGIGFRSGYIKGCVVMGPPTAIFLILWALGVI